jgi:4-alpha-glucanotransferase
VNERPNLRALAERCGIAPAYAGYDGRPREVPSTTHERLLAALGFDVSSEARAAEVLHTLDLADAQPGLAPVRVVRAGTPELRRVEVRLPAQASGTLRYRIEVELEDGQKNVSEGETHADAARLPLALPAAAELQFGYHTLRCDLELGGRRWSSTQDLIVAPPHCLGLSERIGKRRAVGVWTHLYTVHSQRSWGIGDLSDLSSLLDWASNLGLEFLGINPLHAADNQAGEVSPYYTLSRLYRNPIFLAPERAVERSGSLDGRALLATAEVQALRSAVQAHSRVDYAKIDALKRTVLQAAFRTFNGRHRDQNTELGRAYTAYRQREGQPLGRFAVFSALREHLLRSQPGSQDWHAWPVSYRDPDSPAVAAFAAEQREQVEFHAYLQFEFEQQLAACERTARGAGMPIGLYGDLALGDAPFSADIWARQDLYANGANVGAPPDPYSDTGQDWGLAPFHPLGMRADRYRTWRALIRQSLQHTGLLRIDHVMGLGRQFWVPTGALATEGGYVRYPLADLLGILALESRRAGTLVVGEDLGVVPDGFRETMADNAVNRSQVLYFQYGHDGVPLGSRDYARNALATVSTHDLPPVVGFWQGVDLQVRRRADNIPDDAALAQALRMREHDKARLLQLLRREGLLPGAGEPGQVAGVVQEPSMAELVEALHLFLAGSASRLIGIALDDLTLERDALNVPATRLADAPNWARRSRLSLEELRADERIRALVWAIRQRAAEADSQ